LLAAAALAAPFCGTPAAAQLSTGHSGHEGVRYMEDEELFSVIRTMGSCFAQRKQAQAAGFLATAPGSAPEGRAVRALLGNSTSCTPRGSRMSLPRDIIRGAVAEAMYLRTHPAPPAAEEKAAPATAPSLADFTRCVVLRHPREVHDLLATTRLGTREEHEAVVRLAPLLRACLPSSKQLEVVAPLLRLALADALYDRARRLQSTQARVR
jgi:hypothetical protein